MRNKSKLNKYEVPEGWSFEAADFINKLLQRKPANRLGLNGPEEVKSHIWLKNTDWNSIIKKREEAPFVPSPENDNFDALQANAVDKWNEENKDILKQNTLLLKRNSVQDLFAGYYYDHDKTVPKESFKKTSAIEKPVPRHRKAFSLQALMPSNMKGNLN